MHPKLLLADDSVTIQRVIELTFADEDVRWWPSATGNRRSTASGPIVRTSSLPTSACPNAMAMKSRRSSKAIPSFAHIPVLLLTGAFEPIDEARARAVGCDGVLVKPFEPQMVISRVRDLLAGNRVGAATGGSAHAASAAPAPAAVPAGSLEDYFDRLDAALASKTAPAPSLAPARAELAARRRPTLAVAPAAAAPAVDARGSGSHRLEPAPHCDPARSVPTVRSVPGPSPERAQPVAPRRPGEARRCARASAAPVPRSLRSR